MKTLVLVKQVPNTDSLLIRNGESVFGTCLTSTRVFIHPPGSVRRAERGAYHSRRKAGVNRRDSWGLVSRGVGGRRMPPAPGVAGRAPEAGRPRKTGRLGRLWA